MELTKINDILAQLENDKANGRNHVLSLAAALIEWMGFAYAENNKPRLLEFKTLKLKEALAPAPVTGQEQIYRLTAEGQNLRVRFAVLKKFDKKIVQYLVDNNVGLTSYQAGMRGIKHIEGREPYIPQQPYFVHFITTAKYDRLWIVFNDTEQKRILVFRKRLSQTQFIKILPAWHNISARSKPEMAKLFWNSLDVKEVNKDFYKLIKEQFDILIGISKAQNKDFDESMTKQFAVRLIGRYIFCWFLKEKEIIPEALISSDTIEKFKDSYFQTLLSKLFFKTLNAEVTDPARIETITALDELYKNIPYLNGGLFDWHSEDVLFEVLDLNAWLIAFVKVLESFDFTVDESSSRYQHVAIDPEMLGRIFENLLASQNPDTEKMANQRKAFGAFYTPREIVDYMVNESLKAFVETRLFPQLPELDNKVNEPAVAIKGTLFQDIVAEPQPALYNKAEIAEIERKRERLKIKIDKLFAPDCFENPFDKDETIKLRKALSEISVLDPACGSGAFPMGVMLRLMELRQITGHGHRNNYDLKEEILSKNIFGVDIMPMAIEIARLRAWLSLVLESDYKPADRKNNFGIAALPNLDFKFVCANSLIDSGYDAFLENVRHNATLYRLDGEIQKLEQLRNAYFDPRGDKNKKEELQKEFRETKDYIKTEFERLKKSWNLEDFLSKVDDWNPFDDSHPSSFFSPAWMFGIRTGFDVVIGNPPWGADLSKDEKSLYKTNYPEIDSSTPNSFAYFIGFAYRQFKSCFSFVLPDSILIKDFEKTRRLIGNNIRNIQWYQNTGLPDEIRPFVYVEHDVCVLNTFVHKSEEILIDLFPYLNGTIMPIKKTSLKSKTFLNQFDYVFNLMLNDPEIEILKKINNTKEINYLEVHEGIHTGNSRDILFRKDYVGSGCKDLFYGASAGDLINNYFSKTSGWKVLYNKDIIDKDAGNYASLRDEKIFKYPKIYITRTGNPYKAFYDIDTYASNNFFSLQYKNSKDNTEANLKLILPLFLSSLCQFFIRRFAAPRLGNTFVETKIIHLLKFRTPEIGKVTRLKIICLVDEIIQMKKSNQDTAELEKEIDVLVYKLYELTYEEVKVIDKDFWMSEEEYNAIKI